MNGKRVLVVEDDPVLTRVLHDNLAYEGFTVRCVGDGRQAASAAREFAPDLVLLDVNLPGRSGLELCADWRRTSRLPIILLTAKGQKSDKVRGLRLGADWLWNLGRAERHRQFDLDVYVGVGGFVGDLQGPCGPGFLDNRCNGDFYFGGRAPLGAEILLKEAPVSFGVEIAPGVGFAPGRAGLLIDFLLAVRYLL